ncbi:hypothetical protein GCM10010182_79450 [Actinomadura cremea]|nr:hypothetical protein GCM10010182_79450 [Actinomadura cremea]
MRTLRSVPDEARVGTRRGSWLWGITQPVDPGVTGELRRRLGTAAADHEVFTAWRCEIRPRPCAVEEARRAWRAAVRQWVTARPALPEQRDAGDRRTWASSGGGSA